MIPALEALERLREGNRRFVAEQREDETSNPAECSAMNVFAER